MTATGNFSNLPETTVLVKCADGTFQDVDVNGFTLEGDSNSGAKPSTAVWEFANLCSEDVEVKVEFPKNTGPGPDCWWRFNGNQGPPACHSGWVDVAVGTATDVTGDPIPGIFNTQWQMKSYELWVRKDGDTGAGTQIDPELILKRPDSDFFFAGDLIWAMAGAAAVAMAAGILLGRRLSK